MNEEKFWQLIESIHNNGSGRMDEKCDLLANELATLSIEEANAFQILFDEQMDKAYSWELWGAAYVLAGGCSDDAFTDFRAALISRGQVLFKATLTNPDSLAKQTFDEDAFFYEGYQYAVSKGVEKILGSRPERYKPHPSEPSGEEWSEDEESLKLLYPKLWLKAEERHKADAVSYTTKEKPSILQNPSFRLLLKLQIFGVSVFLILYLLNSLLK